MSLKAIVDEVPAGLEDHYTAGTEANDGKFVLSVEPVNGFGLEDVGGLKRTLEDWKGKANSGRTRLEAFGEYTPESIADLATKAQSAGKPNEALESLKAEYAGKLTTSQTEILQLQNKIKEGNHRNSVNNIFGSNATSFKDGSSDVVKMIISPYIGTDDNGNAFIWNDDKTGARMSNKQGAWEKQMSTDEWLEGVKGAVSSSSKFSAIGENDLKSIGFLLASGASTGSGAGSPKASPTGMNAEKWSGMGLDAQTDYANLNGVPKF